MQAGLSFLSFCTLSFRNAYNSGRGIESGRFLTSSRVMERSAQVEIQAKKGHQAETKKFKDFQEMHFGFACALCYDGRGNCLLESWSSRSCPRTLLWKQGRLARRLPSQRLRNSKNFRKSGKKGKNTSHHRDHHERDFEHARTRTRPRRPALHHEHEA